MEFSMNTIANIINDNTVAKIHASIQEVYEDFGADLKWNTIVIENVLTGKSYQALTPRQHREIELGYFTVDDIQELIDTANKLLIK